MQIGTGTSRGGRGTTGCQFQRFVRSLFKGAVETGTGKYSVFIKKALVQRSRHADWGGEKPSGWSQGAVIDAGCQEIRLKAFHVLPRVSLCYLHYCCDTL